MHVSGRLFSTASISVNRVRRASKISFDGPIVFLRQFLMLLTSLYQKPPHHGAFSTMNSHSVCLSVRYCCMSGARIIFLTSLADAVNVLALSDNILQGSPRQLEKHQNAWLTCQIHSQFQVDSTSNSTYE